MFAELANPILTTLFATLDQVRKATTSGTGAATAAILNEFLGTDFDSSTIAPAQGGDEVLARALSVGKAVLGRLEQEFSQGRGGSGTPGGDAAATFAGYGVNFGIQNAIVCLIASLFPWGHLDEIKELGVEVAQNLGLGRLMRVALRPLIQTLIATPYQQELNVKYSPNLLALPQLAKAWSSVAWCKTT